MSTLLRLALEVAGLLPRPALRQTAGLMGLAVVFMLIGLAGFAGAVWIILARATDPVVAALIMGGLGFFLAGLTYVLARSLMRPNAPAISVKEAEALLTDFMAKQDGVGVWMPVLAAGLAGFLAARR